MADQQQQKPAIIEAPVGLVAGATYPLRALVYLTQTPRLWRYVLVPILVNLVVAVGLYVGLLFPGLESVNNLLVDFYAWWNIQLENLPQWLSFLSVLAIILGFLLRVLLVTGLLVAIGFLLVQFGVILGAPFYGQLSEQLELARTGKLPPAEPLNLFTLGRDIGRAILHELKKLVLIISVGLPLLILNFIPGLGTAIASIGGIALAATIVCIDFLDAPLERRRFHFRQKLKLIFRSLPASGTFGLACLGLISIPLLNLLSVPLCITSGTLFFCDRILPKLNEKTQ